MSRTQDPAPPWEDETLLHINASELKVGTAVAGGGQTSLRRQTLKAAEAARQLAARRAKVGGFGDALFAFSPPTPAVFLPSS